jgi:hypothetical protein
MAAYMLPLSVAQAYDQQQQSLVDAASKALSYRQNVLEENIRLTYALQVLFFLALSYGPFFLVETHGFSRCICHEID